VVRCGGGIVEDGRKLLPENAELTGIPEEPLTEVELPKGNGAVAHEVDNGAELVGDVSVGIPPVSDGATIEVTIGAEEFAW